METVSQRLHRILALHFDPQWGSAYWLERERTLGFSVRERILTPEELPLLGPMDLEALRVRPVEDFLPRRFAGRRFFPAETGGATGVPKSTVYFPEELEEAFVTPFLEETRRAGVTWEEEGHWLWLGPGGPHVIARAARRIAALTSVSDGFAIDFDPRWFRKLPPGSVARERYLEHLLEQALAVTRRERIRRLFATSSVLLPLAARLADRVREGIDFLYLGGMAVTMEEIGRLRDAFPRARILSGYGNTLFGVCHQPVDGALCYRVFGQRLWMRLVPLEGEDGERLFREVAVGELGQVVMSRLDESCFLANVMERDGGLRPAPEEGRVGVMEPRPLVEKGFKVERGIY